MNQISSNIIKLIYKREPNSHELTQLNSQNSVLDKINKALNTHEIDNHRLIGSQYDIYNTGIVNANNIYEKVIIYCPNEQNNFSSVVLVDEKNNLLKHSNSYLIDYNFIHHHEYNSIYKIYNRLYKTYIKIVAINKYDNTLINKKYLDNTDEIINYISPFYKSNAGHDLVYICNILDYVRKNNLLDKKIIIMKNMYNFTKNILKLYYKDENIIELDEEEIYIFNKIINIRPVWFGISNYKYITDDIITIINTNLSNNSEIKKYDKICLIKMNDQNCIRKDLNFEGSKDRIEKKGFKIISPEKYNLEELITIFQNAKEIIVQTGGICYTNFMFFNKNAKIYYIHNNHNYSNELQKIFSKLFIYRYEHFESLMNQIEKE